MLVIKINTTLKHTYYNNNTSTLHTLTPVDIACTMSCKAYIGLQANLEEKITLKCL